MKTRGWMMALAAICLAAAAFLAFAYWLGRGAYTPVVVAGPPEKPAAPDACANAPAYLVSKGARKALRIRNCPGRLVSRGFPPKPIQHPFVDASSLDPLEEDALKQVLDKAHSFDEFVSLLRADGYTVEKE
jgi:hypothetical protein